MCFPAEKKGDRDSLFHTQKYINIFSFSRWINKDELRGESDKFDSKHHGVVILTNSKVLPRTIKRVVQYELHYGGNNISLEQTSVRFAKKIDDAIDFLKQFTFSVFIIDWEESEEPLSVLFPFIKDLPGFHSYDYSHVTYIRTTTPSDALRLFIRQLPLTYIMPPNTIETKRFNKSLSFVGEIFNSRIKHEAVTKFFELYINGEYTKAKELSEILYDKQPQREFIYLLYQAARNSIDFVQDEADENLLIEEMNAPEDLKERIQIRNKFLKARQFYHEGNNELANQIFSQIFSKDPEGSKIIIIEIFVWIFERFAAVNKYSQTKEKFTKLNNTYKFILALEPGLNRNKIQFMDFSVSQMNAGFFFCRLDMELAILANVVAYYYSNMEDPVTASKVYALASCFLYDKTGDKTDCSP